MAWGWENYGDYVSADEKRRRADAAVRKLEKQGRKVAPVRLTGRAIASSFWGQAWCRNLEGYSDYESRLPRGRSYVRQGAVLDLQVARGGVKATVSGTRLYEVTVKIDTLEKGIWERLKRDCAGKVGSLMDLLQGKLSAPVMEIVTRREGGLFPEPREILLECSCPDYADLCKHAAAVFYGIGARLDEKPELLFLLRGVDHLELIAAATDSLQAELASPTSESAGTLSEEHLAEIFGIDLGVDLQVAAPASKTKAKRPEPPSHPTVKPGKKAVRTKPVSTVRAAKGTGQGKRTTARKQPAGGSRAADRKKVVKVAAQKKGRARRPV